MQNVRKKVDESVKNMHDGWAQVFGEITEACDDRGRFINWQVVVRCPFCGQQHSHGLGIRDAPGRGTRLGTFAAKCEDRPRGTYGISVK